MVNKLILGLIFSGMLYGQQGNTIYKQLFTNVSSAPLNSANVTNIGQSGHIAFMLQTSKPAHACGAGGMVGHLQFSYNNSTWTSFGSPNTTVINTGNSITFYGGGAFPFVRFVIDQFDTTNCVVNVWYTGSLVTPFSQVEGSVVSGGSANMYNPVIVGGLSGDGINTSTGYNVAAPNVVCNQTAFATITAGATSQVFFVGFAATLHVCSMVMDITADGTAKIVLGNLNPCGNPIDGSPAFHLKAASNPFLWSGGGNGSVITIDANARPSFCIAATGGNVGVMISYAVTVP